MTSSMAWQCGLGLVKTHVGERAKIRAETDFVPQATLAFLALATSCMIQTLSNHGRLKSS